MYDGSWALADVMSQLKKKRAATTLDEKIEKVRKRRKAEDEYFGDIPPLTHENAYYAHKQPQTEAA